MAFERVASLDEIPVGASIAVEVGGEQVALVRPEESVVKAVHNICSHQYYELAPEGWVETNSIECGLHGSTFDLDSGEPETLPALDPIPVYACEVQGEDVLVDVKHQLNDAAVPRH